VNPAPTDPLANAPVLRAVHAAHPDVDIVVLPDPGPVVLDPDAGLRTVPRELAEVEAIADELTGLTPDDRRRTWNTGGAPDLVLPVVTDRVPTPARLTVDRAHALLSDEGWDCRQPVSGAVVQLHAERGGRAVRVVWLDDAVTVTVWGLAVEVDEDTARGLLTGAVDVRG
jgi:hypothetical protein